jgi:hypothetical protein
MGRDACGSPLTGSLTVVRHRPGHRAEPDPIRTYQAAATHSGLSRMGPIASGGTCTPVLDCAVRPLAFREPVRGLPSSSPLGCGSLFVVRF